MFPLNQQDLLKPGVSRFPEGQRGAPMLGPGRPLSKGGLRAPFMPTGAPSFPGAVGSPFPRPGAGTSGGFPGFNPAWQSIVKPGQSQTYQRQRWRLPLQWRGQPPPAPLNPGGPGPGLSGILGNPFRMA